MISVSASDSSVCHDKVKIIIPNDVLRLTKLQSFEKDLWTPVTAGSLSYLSICGLLL